MKRSRPSWNLLKNEIGRKRGRKRRKKSALYRLTNRYIKEDKECRTKLINISKKIEDSKKDLFIVSEKYRSKTINHEKFIVEHDRCKKRRKQLSKQYISTYSVGNEIKHKRNAVEDIIGIYQKEVPILNKYAFIDCTIITLIE